MDNRPDELGVAIDTALHFDRDFFTAHVYRCCCGTANGNRALVDRHGGELRRLGMAPLADLMESLFWFAQADYGRALRAAHRLRDAQLVRFQHEAFLRQAMVYAECGRMDLAGLALNKGLELPRELASNRPRAATLIGAAYCSLAIGGGYKGDWLEEAVSLRVGPTSLTHAAIISARAKHLPESVEYLSRLRQLPNVPKCRFGEALADAEQLSCADRLDDAAAARNRAAAFTAPYQGAAPQATLGQVDGPSLDRLQKQVIAAALMWVDPFLPESGAWGRSTRSFKISESDLRANARELVRFQSAMRSLSSNPKQFVQPGDVA